MKNRKEKHNSGRGGEHRTAGVLDEWLCETLALETIVSETGLVRDPFLVNVLVQAWQDAHHLTIHNNKIHQESMRVNSRKRNSAEIRSAMIIWKQ